MHLGSYNRCTRVNLTGEGRVAANFVRQPPSCLQIVRCPQMVASCGCQRPARAPHPSPPRIVGTATRKFRAR
jgi:hypothetical protein